MANLEAFVQIACNITWITSFSFIIFTALRRRKTWQEKMPTIYWSCFWMSAALTWPHVLVLLRDYNIFS